MVVLTNVYGKIVRSVGKCPVLNVPTLCVVNVMLSMKGFVPMENDVEICEFSVSPEHPPCTSSNNVLYCYDCDMYYCKEHYEAHYEECLAAFIDGQDEYFTDEV